MSILKSLLSLWHRLVIRHVYSILVPFYCCVIKERKGKKLSSALFLRKQKDRMTLLALHADYFFADLEVLSGSSEVKILQITSPWQVRLSNQFYPKRMKGTAYYRVRPGDKLQKRQAYCRLFMLGFLSRLYEKLGIDGVIVGNVRFIYDLDWAYASKLLGKPYFLLFREGLLHSPDRYAVPYERHRRFGRFQGTHVIVHNIVSKKMFVESGFCQDDEVSICGVLRMDRLIERIRCGGHLRKMSRKKLVLFYFTRQDLALGEDDSFHIFNHVTRLMIYFALRYPEIDVIVKSKNKDYPEALNYYENLCLEYFDRRLSSISNFVLTSRLNAHDLILSASVVIGLQSTTLLEAAIAEKSIIIPYFKFIRQSSYVQYLGYAPYFDLFEVADDAKDLVRLIILRLQKNDLSPQVLQKRKEVFERFVSNLEGKASENYVRVIRHFVMEG